jgi:hypothetical protein
MYRFITFSGVVDVRMMEIWKAKTPLKDLFVDGLV